MPETKQQYFKSEKMRTLSLIISISIATLVSCKTSSAPAMGSDHIEPAKTGKSTQSDDVYKMIISFISKGEGIDLDAKKRVDNVIEEFNKTNNTNYQPEKAYWGKEGEVDYMFKDNGAKNLSTEQKKAYLAKIKAAIGSSDIVHISFNKKAVHKR